MSNKLQMLWPSPVCCTLLRRKSISFFSVSIFFCSFGSRTPSANAIDGLLCVQTRLSHQLRRRGDSHCHRLTAIVIGITTNVCLLSRCDVVCWNISIEFGIAQRTHSAPSMEKTKKKKKKMCTRNEPLLQFNWLTHIHDCAPHFTQSSIIRSIQFSIQ